MESGARSGLKILDIINPLKNRAFVNRQAMQSNITFANRLPVMNPQPPEIVNFVDGPRGKTAFKSLYVSIAILSVSW